MGNVGAEVFGGVEVIPRPIVFGETIDLDTISRFVSKLPNPLPPINECWTWPDAPSGTGYGAIWVSRNYLQVKIGFTHRAHRVSYWLFKGDIPDGLIIMHSCDTPMCVSPHHLSVGTVRDNSDDMVRKGRQARVCGEDHSQAKITDEQAIQIHNLIITTDEPYEEIGRRFGITKGMVHMIAIGACWQMLPKISTEFLRARKGRISSQNMTRIWAERRLLA